MKKVIIGKCLLPDLLKCKHMTQAELSDKTGISVSQLSMYMNNKRTMSLQTAMLISWGMKCPIVDLYDWKVKE